jgi:hypothetical protein
MKYEKPQITQLHSAVRAIQGCDNKIGGEPDSCDPTKRPTTNAYEADE